MVGKHTLLWQISDRGGNGKIDVTIFDKMDRIARLNMKTDKSEISIFSATGPVLDWKKTFKWVLSQATSVVYVVAPGRTMLERNQGEAFDLYTEIAKKLNKSWDAIPWQFVLNTIDEEDSHPILKSIPKPLRDCVLKTNAKGNIGIDDLMERLITLTDGDQ